MNAFDRKHFIPGYRGLLRDIGEAGGPLVLLDELIDEEGLAMIMKTLDMGMVVFAAGATLFVSKGDFAIYCEMIDHIENSVDDHNSDDEAVEEVEKPMEMAE